ncbi:MAG: hypothetical protein MI717_03695 [Spirochaetales bacterium]|nr:hypothetical protein [Spirochaetales bacterium]
MNIHAQKNPPSLLPILGAWVPLALMWMMMAVEQPGIAAVVARMSQAKLQLAAFGTTFSIALFVEGPIVQMLAASTAVANNRENYQRLMALMHLLGLSATAIHGFLCIPSIYTPFAQELLGLPIALLEPSRKALLAMLPWTISIGYRRLWQGLLIRGGQTKVIPITMLARLLATFAVLFWGFHDGRLEGAILGGLSLSAGVIAGALTAYFYAKPIIQSLPKANETTSPPMAWSAMVAFYIPLALTNFLNLGVRPIMQMGLARGFMPIESLALWPVQMGYIFLFTAFSLSSQEVVIAKLNDASDQKVLVRFSSYLALGLTLLYGLIAATPLWRLWFGHVSGLDSQLLEMAQTPLLFAIPLIPASAFISLLRGALVRQKRTKDVTWGVAVNVTVLLLLLFGGVSIIQTPAVNTMAAAFTLAALAELTFLFLRHPLMKMPHENVSK